MYDVVLVKFKETGKVYYFDPAGFNIDAGMGVIVETSRGPEFGIAASGVTQVKKESITKPLKQVIRIANEEDVQIHEDNEKKKDKALKICQEKVMYHQLDMKLIDVEYTFDNNKIIFYFTSDGRVDFRELVKDLASVFKMRIELRQIGVRDEAKMLGGVGACGKGLCCATWIREFQPVSIKMAKVQNLSLNPAKISGVCGRLMCCLKYENDMYVELQKGMPGINEKITTPDGQGKVMDTNVLVGKVRVRLYTGEFDENGVEKLGTEVLTYDKEDIIRSCCKGKCPKRSVETNENELDFEDLENSILVEEAAEIDGEFVHEDVEMQKSFNPDSKVKRSNEGNHSHHRERKEGREQKNRSYKKSFNGKKRKKKPMINHEEK